MTIESLRSRRSLDQAGDSFEQKTSTRAALSPITVRVSQAAKMIGISRSRLYELIISGDIETLKLGRVTLIPVDSLHALIERLRREQSDR